MCEGIEASRVDKGGKLCYATPLKHSRYIVIIVYNNKKMIRTLVIVLGLTAAIQAACPASNELAGVIAGISRLTQAPSVSLSHPTTTPHPRTHTASSPHSAESPASLSVLPRLCRHLRLRPHRIAHRPLRIILSQVPALSIRSNFRLQVRPQSLALAPTRIPGQHSHRLTPRLLQCKYSSI